MVKRVVPKANLISWELYDFDVILGMNWLSTYRTFVDYFTKKVVFWKLGYPELKFESDRKVLPTCVISALKTKRLLHKGCEAYMEHVVDKSSSKVILDNVPIVREFLDLFLEDLPILPPNGELELGIELLSSSALISIPPYRMTPIELKELKTQLQDLIDKGFI